MAQDVGHSIHPFEAYMRYLLCLILAICFCSAMFSAEIETPEERARRVRVALAVSTALEPITPAVTQIDPPSCGRCSDDLEDARRVSRNTGKPIVLFVSVNGCEGRAQKLPTEVLAVRSNTYSLDGKPATESRVLILTPGYRDWQAVWNIETTLLGDASMEAIKAELEKTRGRPAVQAAPVPQQFAAPSVYMLQNCPSCRQK